MNSYEENQKITAKSRAHLLFDAYVCCGDSVSVSEGLYDFHIRVEPDYETRPTDYDCYTGKAIRAWERDEWFYCGLVVSAEYNGVPLPDGCLASLWGIEANFPGTDNGHLSEIARELLPEAREQAAQALEDMLKKLNA